MVRPPPRKVAKTASSTVDGISEPESVAAERGTSGNGTGKAVVEGGASSSQSHADPVISDQVAADAVFEPRGRAVGIRSARKRPRSVSAPLPDASSDGRDGKGFHPGTALLVTSGGTEDGSGPEASATSSQDRLPKPVEGTELNGDSERRCPDVATAPGVSAGDSLASLANAREQKDSCDRPDASQAAETAQASTVPDARGRPPSPPAADEAPQRQEEPGGGPPNMPSAVASPQASQGVPALGDMGGGVPTDLPNQPLHKAAPVTTQGNEESTGDISQADAAVPVTSEDPSPAGLVASVPLLPGAGETSQAADGSTGAMGAVKPDAATASAGEGTEQAAPTSPLACTRDAGGDRAVKVEAGSEGGATDASGGVAVASMTSDSDAANDSHGGLGPFADKEFLPVKQEGGASGGEGGGGGGGGVRGELPQEPDTELVKLIRQLIGLDTHGFFLDPVTDDVAPNYSVVIRQPMCFATMLNKARRREYATWRAFVDDFTLVCNNATVYNRKRSAVHMAALALLRQGNRVLAPIGASKGDALQGIGPRAPSVPSTPGQAGPLSPTLVTPKSETVSASESPHATSLGAGILAAESGLVTAGSADAGPSGAKTPGKGASATTPTAAGGKGGQKTGAKGAGGAAGVASKKAGAAASGGTPPVASPKSTKPKSTAASTAARKPKAPAADKKGGGKAGGAAVAMLPGGPLSLMGMLPEPPLDALGSLLAHGDADALLRDAAHLLDAEEEERAGGDGDADMATFNPALPLGATAGDVGVGLGGLSVAGDGTAGGRFACGGPSGGMSQDAGISGMVSVCGAEQRNDRGMGMHAEPAQHGGMPAYLMGADGGFVAGDGEGIGPLQDGMGMGMLAMTDGGSGGLGGLSCVGMGMLREGGVPAAEYADIVTPFSITPVMAPIAGGDGRQMLVLPNSAPSAREARSMQLPECSSSFSDTDDTDDESGDEGDIGASSSLHPSSWLPVPWSKGNNDRCRPGMGVDTVAAGKGVDAGGRCTGAPAVKQEPGKCREVGDGDLLGVGAGEGWDGDGGQGEEGNVAAVPSQPPLANGVMPMEPHLIFDDRAVVAACGGSDGGGGDVCMREAGDAGTEAGASIIGATAGTDKLCPGNAAGGGAEEGAGVVLPSAHGKGVVLERGYWGPPGRDLCTIVERVRPSGRDAEAAAAAQAVTGDGSKGRDATVTDAGDGNVARSEEGEGAGEDGASSRGRHRALDPEWKRYRQGIEWRCRWLDASLRQLGSLLRCYEAQRRRLMMRRQRRRADGGAAPGDMPPQQVVAGSGGEDTAADIGTHPVTGGATVGDGLHAAVADGGTAHPMDMDVDGTAAAGVAIAAPMHVPHVGGVKKESMDWQGEGEGAPAVAMGGVPGAPSDQGPTVSKDFPTKAEAGDVACASMKTEGESEDTSAAAASAWGQTAQPACGGRDAGSGGVLAPASSGRAAGSTGQAVACGGAARLTPWSAHHAGPRHKLKWRRRRGDRFSEEQMSRHPLFSRMDKNRRRQLLARTTSCALLHQLSAGASVRESLLGATTTPVPRIPLPQAVGAGAAEPAMIFAPAPVGVLPQPSPISTPTPTAVGGPPGGITSAGVIAEAPTAAMTIPTPMPVAAAAAVAVPLVASAWPGATSPVLLVPPAAPQATVPLVAMGADTLAAVAAAAQATAPSASNSHVARPPVAVTNVAAGGPAPTVSAAAAAPLLATVPPPGQVLVVPAVAPQPQVVDTATQPVVGS